MLAAWFRIKYPHVCAGAIAASAPVAQFTSPCDAFGRIVTSDYTAAVANGTCSQNIRKSWAALDRDGLDPSIIKNKLDHDHPLRVFFMIFWFYAVYYGPRLILM